MAWLTEEPYIRFMGRIDTSLACDCGEEMPMRALESRAGWYLGFECPRCGPGGRVTDYFRSEKAALEFLNAHLRELPIIFEGGYDSGDRRRRK